LAGLSACAESDPNATADPTARSRFVRLALRPESPSPRAPTELVASLAIPADVEPWRVEPGGATSRTSSGRTRLVIDGPRRHAVSVPGPFDPATFNQLTLALRTPEPLTARLAFSAAGEHALSSRRNLFVPGSETTQLVTFDLSRTRHVDGPLDELAIEILDADAPWELEGIELFHQPWVEFLPHVQDGPDSIESVHVARRGVGLSSACPLVTDVAVVPPNAVLTYAYSWPRQVRDPNRTAELRVSVEGPASRIVETHALGQGSWTEPDWQSARIELATLGDGPLRVRFELRADGPLEALCALAEVACVAPLERPRTVLFVTSDTHRADHVEGDVRAVPIDTPALAALARRGTRFADCQSTTNVTLPSHIALMTATHPRDHGVWTNRASISGDAETLAEAFRAAGFVTWASVSNRYLGRIDTGLGQGFDRIAWPREATDDAATTVERLLRWLPEAQGRPLFCWVHVFDAHTPYAPPAEYFAPYRAELPEQEDPSERVRNPNRALNPDVNRARYKAEISYLDHELGRLFAEPRFRSGVCAVTADHGEGLGEHGIWWTHNGLYPEVVRVPLILAGPGVEPGRSVERAVRHMDIGRTLLDLAGLERQPFPGASLLATGHDPDPRFGLGAHARHASITVDGWHLTLNLVEQPRSAFFPDLLFERHAVELYDLTRDPACEHDLARTEPERARKLRAALCAWLESAQPAGWGSAGVRDEEVLAQMAELGYTVDAPPSSLVELFDRDCDCEHCAAFR